MGYRHATLTLTTVVLAACTEPTPPPAPVTPPSGEPAAAAQAAGGDPTAEVAPGDTGAAEPGDVDVTGLVPGPQATDLAAGKVQLPPDWKGTGVLARRSDVVPRRAPPWAGVAAQVVDRDGQRLLVVTGRASQIKDAHLARSTAENRARDEARRWTGVEKQEGGAIKNTWRDRRTGDTFVQLELPVAADWTPAR